MMVVLDTSAAVDLILHPAERDVESRVLAEAQWVLAPTLYISEVTNVFWKYCNFQQMSMDQAEAGMALALDLPDTFSEDRELCVEAFSMACRTQHSVYDMLYLVLARRNNALLLTRDRMLKQLAAEHDVRVS